MGAAGAIDYVNEDVVAGVRDITGGAGIDLVVDNVGEATFADSIRVCRKGGRIVTCGATTGPKIPVDVRRVFWKQISILGSTMGDASEFTAMSEFVGGGKIDPVIDQTFALDDGRAAFERLERAEQFGKIVLDIR
jgi:NADPH:quinone reductase-like Zn-dependent oxidoreductase